MCLSCVEHGLIDRSRSLPALSRENGIVGRVTRRVKKCLVYSMYSKDLFERLSYGKWRIRLHFVYVLRSMKVRMS